MSPDDYARLQRQAVFACCKWHTQAEDRPVLCSFPLVLDAGAWEELARLADALAREALAAEQELRRRPELHGLLGLPAALRRCLRRAPAGGPSDGDVRVLRFDFHWTADGWRITEVNADVAGGFIEGSGVTQLVAAHYPHCRPVGDPAGALADAIRRRVRDGAVVGLMHLTVYTEDRQVMLYLARRLAERGVSACLFGPAQLRWRDGRATALRDGHAGPLDFAFRYFPAEWLPRLPRATGWGGFFGGGTTAVCNPGCAVLTQSKRFPLVWDRLVTPLPTWRGLLPETRSPAEIGGDFPDGWVIKPALGHEGHDVAIGGVTDRAEWRQVRRAARRRPAAWAAQRRFEPLPLPTPDGPAYPCVGVYVIDGRVAGTYGRLASRPLIDYRSREVAVLVRSDAHEDTAIKGR